MRRTEVVCGQCGAPIDTATALPDSALATASDEILSFHLWMPRGGAPYLWAMAISTTRSIAELQAEAERPTLRRVLGPLNLTALGVGSVIGTAVGAAMAGMRELS